jgi:hypothetical protein
MNDVKTMGQMIRHEISSYHQMPGTVPGLPSAQLLSWLYHPHLCQLPLCTMSSGTGWSSRLYSEAVLMQNQSKTTTTKNQTRPASVEVGTAVTQQFYLGVDHFFNLLTFSSSCLQWTSNPPGRGATSPAHLFDRAEVHA